MTTPRLTDPVNLLRAWLHDPPDKALDIRGHERRTDALLGVILGEEGHGAVGATKDADVVASYLERLPMPTAGREGERAVGLENGLRAVHTLSGHGRALDAEALSPSAPPSRTREILAQLGRDDAWRRFLSVWRALPTRLADEHSDWRSLPADTRQPDHSIWQHMDTAAAF
ncbi:MAG: hypothetical protein U0326_23960 [Polyangiales bacterium]